MIGGLILIIKIKTSKIKDNPKGIHKMLKVYEHFSEKVYIVIDVDTLPLPSNLEPFNFLHIDLNNLNQYEEEDIQGLFTYVDDSKIETYLFIESESDKKESVTNFLNSLNSRYIRETLSFQREINYSNLTEYDKVTFMEILGFSMGGYNLNDFVEVVEIGGEDGPNTSSNKGLTSIQKGNEDGTVNELNFDLSVHTPIFNYYEGIAKDIVTYKEKIFRLVKNMTIKDMADLPEDLLSLLTEREFIPYPEIYQIIEGNSEIMKFISKRSDLL